MKCIRLLGVVVTIIKYNKITMYHSIYIKVLSGVTVSYSTFSDYDIMNTKYEEIAFPKLRKVFKEEFDILKYLNCWIS